MDVDMVADNAVAMEVEQSFHSLSSLESLPKELLWKVFEYTPELALDFRLTSHTLRCHLDDFAVAQSKIPIVSRLSVSDFRLPNSTKPVGELGLMFDVPAEKSGLFYLRLFLLNYTTFKEDMRKLEDKKDGEEELVKNHNSFDVTLDVDSSEIDKNLEQLNEWIGRKVGLASFQNLEDAKKCEAFTKLLKGTQFCQLKIIADKLSEDVSKTLLKTMVAHKVDQLVMSGKFETESDTVLLLRQLASYIRSIHIYQTPFKNAPEGVSTLKRLFGANCDDWASVFVDMFRGNLDKLCISNSWHSGYLTGSGSDRLKEELTKLGKNVWFMGTCEGYADGFETDAYNEYTVKVNAPAPVPANNQQPTENKCKQYLHIIHKARQDERPIGEVSMDAK